MHRLSSACVLALVALLQGTISECAAAPIVFEITGEVTAVPVSDPSDPFGGTLATGTTLSVTYEFDSNSSDSIPGDSASGSFTSSGSPYGLTATIDGVVVATTDAVTVNTQNSVPDFYGVFASSGQLTISILFTDPTGSALSSDALPLSPASLAGLFTATASRSFDLFYDDSGDTGLQYQVQGDITKLCLGDDCVVAQVAQVPEPSSLNLMAAAVLILGASFSWRRQGT